MKKIGIIAVLSVMSLTMSNHVWAMELDNGVVEVARIKANHVEDFSEGLAAFKVNEEWGFVDIEGNIVMEPQWQETRGFSDGLARVKRNDKYRFIDKQGNVIVQPEWDATGIWFSDGMLKVKKNNKWGYVNTNGEVVLEPQWDSVGDFHEGLAGVEINGEWGFIDKEGNIVIEAQWEYAGSFNNGIASITQYSERGFIDIEGNVIIEPQFEQIWSSDFSEGLVAVSRNDKYGFIDINGEFVIEPQFDDAGSFSDGLGFVKVNDKCGFINEKGEFIIEPTHEVHNGFNEGFTDFGSYGEMGIIDTNGNIVIPKEYKEVTKVENGMVIVCDGEEAIIYDLNDINGEMDTIFEEVKEEVTVTSEESESQVFFDEVGANSDPSTIKSVQETLNTLGYACGTADGIAGQKTKSAIEKYQSEHNLTVTGTITMELLDSMIEELGELADNAKGTNSNARNIDNIVSKMKTMATSNNVTIVKAASEGNMTGYIINCNDSMFGMFSNIKDDGKMVILIMPEELDDEDGSNDYLDVMSYLVRAVDGSLDGYDAYTVAVNTVSEEKNFRNGIEYAFSSEGWFTATF